MQRKQYSREDSSKLQWTTTYRHEPLPRHRRKVRRTLEQPSQHPRYGTPVLPKRVPQELAELLIVVQCPYGREVPDLFKDLEVTEVDSFEVGIESDHEG